MFCIGFCISNMKQQQQHRVTATANAYYCGAENSAQGVEPSRNSAQGVEPSMRACPRCQAPRLALGHFHCYSCHHIAVGRAGDRRARLRIKRRLWRGIERIETRVIIAALEQLLEIYRSVARDAERAVNCILFRLGQFSTFATLNDSPSVFDILGAYADRLEPRPGPAE